MLNEKWIPHIIFLEGEKQNKNSCNTKEKGTLFYYMAIMSESTYIQTPKKKKKRKKLFSYLQNQIMRVCPRAKAADQNTFFHLTFTIIFHNDISGFISKNFGRVRLLEDKCVFGYFVHMM